ncbi:uncharacterized protein LOC105181989 isoform X2 [Harpegnathos saltator]|uniref:uncharacterized protein LOC105181989 isoform X2 n=1 Tax=Harpegnathos saltator TaxID=610380 RepID=UPI000948BF5B|nr:uncharacterized protein LOC105181989 isoform X2 [Harpegnathos saltator]
MREKLTLAKVIYVVKLSLFVICFWPQPKDAIKLKVICVALYQYFSILLHLSLALSLMNTVKNHLNNHIIMAEAIIIICATMHAICNIVVYRINLHHLQSIIFEMENFYKLIKPHEEAILQKYISKCVIFYEYPFDVSYQPMKTIVYAHQSICALQAASHICINIFTSLLLWFTSARFELLTENLRAIRNIYDLMKCIQEHQKLLKYTEQVIRVIRPFAFIVVCCSTSALIILGLVFITEQRLSIKIQCVGLICSGLSEVFMHTWPAEHLIYICNKIGEAVYSAKWYKHSVELQKSVQIMLMRAQKPLTIMIPCVMPSLSLSYYASYLSTIFSYFTTLRIFMQSNQNVD